MANSENELLQKVEQLFKERKNDDIITLLNNEVLEQNNSAALYAYIARANGRTGSIELRRRYAEKAIYIDPSFAMGYLARGHTWFNKRDYDQAIADYNKAIELDEKFVDAYFSRGYASSEKNDYDPAIADYTKAIELDEKFTDAYNNRGNEWYNKKSYDLAIKDYDKAIELDEKYPNAYYNRAKVYNKQNDLKRAIGDYTRYIELIEDPNDYYAQVAKAEIEELNKKLADDWYKEIGGLVTDIKQLLLFDKPCITHYTGLCATKAMLLGNSLFRLSEGTFLNDTSEGKVLFKYLLNDPKSQSMETNAMSFAEKPFIGSFVTGHKFDDLALWRMYGKEAQVEAKGCALTIYQEKLISNLETKLSKSDGEEDKTAKNDDNFSFYKVAYKDDDKFLLPDDTGKSDELNGLLSKLKDVVGELNEEQRIEAAEKLNEIAYLFKSIEYRYENEVRLVVNGVGFPKIIDTTATPPKVYIQLVEILPVLHKITIGPKVERAEEWYAAFHYKIKEQKLDVEIVISHLPFK